RGIETGANLSWAGSRTGESPSRQPRPTHRAPPNQHRNQKREAKKASRRMKETTNTVRPRRWGLTRVLGLLVACAAPLSPPVAQAADDPQAFVQRETQRLSDLLRQPKSGGRDARVTQELDATINYDRS